MDLENNKKKGSEELPELLAAEIEKVSGKDVWSVISLRLIIKLTWTFMAEGKAITQIG